MSSLRSMSNASIGGGISIKFELQRPKEVELRRLRGEFSFDQLTTAVAHLWGGSSPKNLVIEYVDDEGDRIKVGSEAEWSETTAQHLATCGQAPLRLFVRRGRRSGKKSIEVPSASESEGEGDIEVKAPLRVPSLQLPQPPATAPTAKAEMRAEGSTTTKEGGSNTVPPAGVENPIVEAGDDTQTAVVDLLSRLYDCDAGREMMNMFSSIDFAPVVRRRLDAVAGEVLVDIDNAALRCLTVSQTNMWIGQRLFEKAEGALKAALGVWPNDHVLEYNAACAAALRGDKISALSRLESAVAHGYCDVDHLLVDSDLAGVRDCDRFRAIIALMRPEPERPAAPSKDHEPSSVKPLTADVPKQAAKPQEQWDPVATLIAMFPSLSTDAASRVLKRNNGDLARAASSLLQ